MLSGEPVRPRRRWYVVTGMAIAVKADCLRYTRGVVGG
jgi:hypothetical protein